ncbi:MAG TPA: 23S rRNA (pseudouridine(1915)-N(3))-methyltransferase RlmH [Candidatus Saccharimonadales bacterium]|nr:23S rRNA (pseudouridine(1915)-N(3))-methyltransferase RlmH [Candidatus Saccharimonadales bacterium]
MTMQIHIITVGKPKLPYAVAGCEKYLGRLKRYHQVRVTHVADKYAYDAGHLLQAAGSAYTVVLVIDGEQLSSPELAQFLEKRALSGRELCCIVGGPEGLPAEVITQADCHWSLSKLTFPHDLAMVVLAETLYRASTILARRPYHK